MQRVSWRYGEPKSSAMSRQPAGNWASPAACSTAGEIGTGSTVERGFIPSATRGAEVVPTACRSKSYPTCGPGFYALQLAQQQRPLSPSTIYRALRRVGLGTRHERLLLLERHSAERSGLLTERTRRQRQRARRQRRHVQASEPGELVCLDTFLHRPPQGRREGLADHGVRDAACSYAVARIIPACTSDHAVRFLVDSLLPFYEAAGWPLQRVLTDRGSEFQGQFRCGVSRSRDQTYAHQAAPPLDQRLRRAPAEHDPSPALARRLPPQVFHHRAATGRVPAAVP